MPSAGGLQVVVEAVSDRFLANLIWKSDQFEEKNYSRQNFQGILKQTIS